MGNSLMVSYWGGCFKNFVVCGAQNFRDFAFVGYAGSFTNEDGSIDFEVVDELLY